MLASALALASALGALASVSALASGLAWALELDRRGSRRWCWPGRWLSVGRVLSELTPALSAVSVVLKAVTSRRHRQAA